MALSTKAKAVVAQFERRSERLVTFSGFGRLDGDGGRPSKILLDGVYVGEIAREIDERSVGVMQKVHTVRAYVASLQGPISDTPGAEAFDDKEFTDLAELKRKLVAVLRTLPEEVPTLYTRWWAKKISSAEVSASIQALLRA